MGPASKVGAYGLLGAWTFIGFLALASGQVLGERLFGVITMATGIIPIYRVSRMGLLVSDYGMTLRGFLLSKTYSWNEVRDASIGSGNSALPTITIVLHLRDGRDRVVQSVARSSLIESDRTVAALSEILDAIRKHLHADG